MGCLSPVFSAVSVSVPPLPPSLYVAGNNRGGMSAKTNSHARRSRVRVGPRNRVLIFGRIRELALYRAEVLHANGFSVITPQNKAETVAAIRGGGFDVAVLTYTLSSDTVEELAELVRQHCPECRLITISETRNYDARINPDANVIADDGPKALLQALRSLLKRS
jgi:hypothetical protein